MPEPANQLTHGKKSSNPLNLNIIFDCEGTYLSFGEAEDFVEKYGLLTRVYRRYVNRDIPSDKKSLDLLLARGVRELITLSRQNKIRTTNQSDN